MKIYNNVSAQKVSWVKSNKKKLEERNSQIENLYYPENLEEFLDLIGKIRSKGEVFELIGYSSNTLFLPSYSVKHLICTKLLNKWYETDDMIVCDCGVNVATLSKEMVNKGYVGFEGLTDLPGTLGAAVYGNCGCRNCSVNDILEKITMLLPNGNVRDFYVDDLGIQYRSTVLKRGSLTGTILQVYLRKEQGNAEELKLIAEKNHRYRQLHQPKAANNLGTTFIGKHLTLKGRLYSLVEFFIGMFTGKKAPRYTYAKLLSVLGKSEFIPYVYYWNRYMFFDESSHVLFPKYITFLKGLYKDLHLEIEIRK